MKSIRQRTSGTIKWLSYPAIAALVILSTIPSAFALQFPTEQTSSVADIKRQIKQADKMYRQAIYPEAEKILRGVVESNPNNTTAKLKLAHVILKRRMIVEAYELSYPIAVAEPNNSFALAVIGSVLLSAGRLKEARPLFYRAIQLDKSEALAWAGFGLIDFYENRIDEAVLNLREAVIQEPSHADFTFALAQISARAERYSEAADTYQRFLSLSRDPDDERRDRIKGLVTFLRFLGNRAALYSSSGSESTKISFELVGNRPVLPLKVNGRNEQLNFVLDTGSGISVISKATAKRLKIKPITRGGFAKGIGGDGKFEIIYGFLNELKIGDVRVRNVPVYIREFHSPGIPVDGYIGLSVISKFLTTVDYGESTFTLDRSAAVMTAANEDTRSLPLRLTSSGFLSGEVILEGLENPVNFIVDTGASVSVISQELAAVESMRINESATRMRVVGAAGITEDVRSFIIPKISFGDHSRLKILAVALDLDLINEASGFEHGGILGGNFLKSYKLTFDFRNARVLFDPVADVPIDQAVPLE